MLCIMLRSYSFTDQHTVGRRVSVTYIFPTGLSFYFYTSSFVLTLNNGSLLLFVLLTLATFPHLSSLQTGLLAESTHINWFYKLTKFEFVYSSINRGKKDWTPSISSPLVSMEVTYTWRSYHRKSPLPFPTIIITAVIGWTSVSHATVSQCCS